MDIHMRHETNAPIITLTGELAQTDPQALHNCFDEVRAKPGCDVILDIQLVHINADIANLVGIIIQEGLQISQTHKPDGTACRMLVVTNGDMDEVLELINANNILERTDSVEGALQDLARNAQ